MKFITQLLLLVFLGSFSLSAQQKPSFITTSDQVQFVPSLASRDNLPAPVQKGEINPKRKSGSNIIVPGKGLPKTVDPLLQNFKRSISHPASNPIMTFEAARNGATPTDPTGAAGPNHYVVAYNTAFKIFDKDGNVLVPDTALSSLFPNHVSDGDPIVLYDQFADRFLITNFDISSNPNKFLVAVSQTADPVNGGWYVYAFPVNSMPDYPKFSIWSDGYYVTANKDSSSADSSEVVFALERDKMLAGNTNAQMVGFSLPEITTSGFYSPAGFNVNGTDLPPAGNAPIVYLQDDSWSGVNQDHLKIWNINVDWTTPANSSISTPQELSTSAFNSVFNNGSFVNLPQPSGSDIDALQATIMFMTNYRRFNDHNAVVLNFVVNTDGQGKAGIRWFELRQQNDGEPWYVYQEGTFIDPSNHHTFAGSINMDVLGNIALGYTIVDSNQFPELHFTGRYVNDPINQMTITPQAFVPGTAADPSSRYGDYAQLVVDPNDDKTFWFIGEYFTNDGRIDQVGVFKFAPDFDNDLGVSDITAPTNGILTNNETITVNITNYGMQDQSNFPVSYQINGGSVVTENYTGSISPNATVSYSFSTTADLSVVGQDYTITARTNLAGDQEPNNDSATVTVTNLPPNDMGITAVLAPVSSDGLGATENIEVIIKNYGGASQTNVPVSYTLNGNTVDEVAPGPFPADSQQSYTFTQTADFSAVGTYNLTARTNLPNDADPSNDAFSTTIVHNMCQPSSNCEYGDAITHFQFGTIDNTSDCGTDGYSDFTNLSTDLLAGDTYDMSITVSYSKEYVAAWIDFNDNFNFDANEKVVADFEIAPNQSGSGSFTEVFSINIPANANLGEHLMRIRTNWQNPVPDPCTDVNYGETEDYKVNITNTNAIDVLEGIDIILKTIGNNHYLVSLESKKMTDDVNLQVYTMGGKQIVYHVLKNRNGQYTYDLDLSFVSKGVYLLKIGNQKVGKIKKIIVD